MEAYGNLGLASKIQRLIEECERTDSTGIRLDRLTLDDLLRHATMLERIARDAEEVLKKQSR